MDSYAGNTETRPVASVDAVDLVRVGNSRLKTRRDARPCRYRATEAALLKIGSRISATGLNNSRHTDTAMPYTDIGPVIISFNERAGLTVVTRAENSRTESDGEECC